MSLLESLLAGQTPWTGRCRCAEVEWLRRTHLFGPHVGLCLLLENSYHLWLGECWLAEFGVAFDWSWIVMSWMY